jgi:glucose-6-phosphate 1-dehydrogenase
VVGRAELGRRDVDNWRWAGVPFYIRTGKRLPKRVTEVVLQFQRPPHLPIRLDQATGLSPDALILRIQPDEGITLRFGVKVPGHSFLVGSATMEFNYQATFVEESPEAKERLLLDALIGDPDPVHPLRRGRPVLAHHRSHHQLLGRRSPAHHAVRGRILGPSEADRLQRDGRAWRNS